MPTTLNDIPPPHSLKLLRPCPSSCMTEIENALFTRMSTALAWVKPCCCVEL